MITRRLLLVIPMAAAVGIGWYVNTPAENAESPPETSEAPMTQSTQPVVIADADFVPQVPVLGRPTTLPPQQLTPLAELKDQTGLVLVPGYLPAGYSLDGSRLRLAGGALLTYRAPGGVLTISHDPLPPRLRLPPGSFTDVNVRGSAGYLIEGGWGRVIHENGVATPITWREWVATILLFERDGMWISVVMSPGDSLSESELFKLAESLQPYQE